MRLYCTFCGKSVSSEVHEDTVVRAALVCPECIEAGEIVVPDPYKWPSKALNEKLLGKLVATNDYEISHERDPATGEWLTFVKRKE
jgi:hypothetical protein